MKPMDFYAKTSASMDFSVAALSISVFTAVCLGLFCGFSAGDVWSSLVRGALCGTVSTVARIGCMLLPLLLALPAWSLGNPVLLIPVCFVKTFSFSACLAGLYGAFGSGWWLAGCLMMFGSGLSLLFLLYWTLRQLDGFRPDAGVEFNRLLFGLLGIGLLDIWIVAPFLANIITF